jgi:hypothetical protein
MKKSIVHRPHKPESKGFIEVKKGDILSFESRETIYPGWIWCTDAAGNQAWVPLAYVSIDGTTCKFIQDYSSRELEVKKGEVVRVLEEESGWVWVYLEDDLTGWIPLECLAALKESKQPE